MNEKPLHFSAFILPMLIVVIAGFGLRYGTNVLTFDNVRDEYKMKVPIDNIAEQGWSIDTAINYQEVKGPGFIWPYALGAQLLDNNINSLRLLSVLFFIGGAVPLLLMAGRSGVRHWTLAVVALLYALLPYNALTSQLLFSEPSFNFFALWMLWAFVRCDQDELRARPLCRLGFLALFTIMLSILLHHRPQAVALAAAVALVAFERDGLRSWPWILACVIAGLTRLPLWMHWGGLVTSDYQGLFGFGFRVQPVTYLLAAMVPMIGIFLWPVLFDRAYRSRRWWVAVGGGAGLLLGLFLAPDLAAHAQYALVTVESEQTQRLYSGTVATAVKMVLTGSLMQHVALALLAAVGGASLAAMALLTWSHSVLASDGATCRLAFWMLAAGVPLYAMTSGPVYDRYLGVWIVLLPIVWALALPRSAIVMQTLLIGAMLAYMVNEYLM